MTQPAHPSGVARPWETGSGIEPYARLWDDGTLRENITAERRRAAHANGLADLYQRILEDRKEADRG